MSPVCICIVGISIRLAMYVSVSESFPACLLYLFIVHLGMIANWHNLFCPFIGIAGDGSHLEFGFCSSRMFAFSRGLADSGFAIVPALAAESLKKLKQIFSNTDYLVIYNMVKVLLTICCWWQ